MTPDWIVIFQALTFFAGLGLVAAIFIIAIVWFLERFM